MDERRTGYSIGQVSDLLGVPAPTIRSWERRHGLGPEGHTGAGHRRYTRSDVDLLRRMRDEVAAGRGAGDAAVLVRSLRTGAPPLLVQAFCAASHRLDDGAVVEVLDSARALHGLPVAVELVLLPAMRELGRQWTAGGCDIAHEHLATVVAQGWLKDAVPREQLRSAPVQVLLACAPDEQHTLGLDGFAALLGDRGLRCLHLGARVPASSLRVAVATSGARAVVLGCQLSSHRRSAVAALHAVEDSCAVLHYCGAAFGTPASRAGVPGRYLGTSLAQATEELVTAAAATAVVAT